jgi:hypothetical protein
MRRLLVGALAGMGALFLSAGSAGAVTIGQLDPAVAPAATCFSGPVEELNPDVTSGTPYVVPGAPPGTSWLLTSWSTRATAGAGQRLTMKVFRPLPGLAQYRVVGHDGRYLAGGQLNTFATSLAVQPGDILGLNSANASSVANDCLFDAPGDDYRYYDSSLHDGAVGSFTFGANARPNIEAELRPVAASGGGKTRRCKKKPHHSRKKKCRKHKK